VSNPDTFRAPDGIREDVAQADGLAEGDPDSTHHADPGGLPDSKPDEVT